MAANFHQEYADRLSDLQDQVSQKEAQVKELIVQHGRELEAANEPFVAERAAHAITRAELANAARELQELHAKLDRGMMKHGDWDELSPPREACPSLCRAVHANSS